MAKRKIIAYLRLSREDGDNTESGSITNQRKIIQEYAHKHGMHIEEEDFIVDDGYSGFTMDRPGFNKIKKLLNDGVECIIIAKDLSRIGRHSASVQLFLEKAREYGSRVITLGENCDTDIEESQQYVGIHTWANEHMIRETSRKVRNSIDTTQREGKVLGNVPYGYIKDDRQKYVYYVDELTAPYVKLMFDLYIEGQGVGKIARTLTEMNVPTPSVMRKIRAEERGKKYNGKFSAIWETGVVSRIIRNDFYIGTLTLNKTRRRTINGKAIKQTRDEMYIFPNSHPPIIDMATWNLAQEICDKRRATDYRGMKRSRRNIFAGSLICADCGKHLTSAGGVDGNTRYVCKTYNTHGTSQCTSHAVSEQEIAYVMLDFLEYCKDNLELVINDLDKIISAELQVKHETDPTSNIEQIEKLIKDTKKGIEILIEQKMRETMKNPSMTEMIDKMYDEMLNDKYKQLQTLEKQLSDQQQMSIDEIEMKKDLNSALNILNEILTTREITKKQVLLLVDKIIIHADTGIDFYLKGNLHQICKGYFRVSGSKISIIKRHMYDYILQNRNKFNTNHCTVYIRNQGTKLAWKTVSEILNKKLVDNNIVVFDTKLNGYKLIGTEEQLRAALIPNTVMDIHRCLRHDNVIKTIRSISEWIQSMQYRKVMF